MNAVPIANRTLSPDLDIVAPLGGQSAHKDEARRLAANFAKLPEMLRRTPSQ